MAKRRWTNEEIAEYRKSHDGFYVNREDSRVFVRKAYGVGFTLNWANPLAYVALAALVGAVIALKFFLGR